MQLFACLHFMDASEELECCKRVSAHPLPPYWPKLALPMGAVTPLSMPCTLQEFTTTQAAEQKQWAELELAKQESGPCTPVKKGKGKAKMKDVEREREEFERANWAGEKCKCGKVAAVHNTHACTQHLLICMHSPDAIAKSRLHAFTISPHPILPPKILQADTERFMLACDGCEIWFHGDCVGITQQQASRLKEWRCKPCTRKHDRLLAASATYCVCIGPWDGRSFMIACDGCSTWFHGACVGLRVESATEGAQAAFRRYLCPHCSRGKERVHTAGGSRGQLAGTIVDVQAPDETDDGNTAAALSDSTRVPLSRSRPSGKARASSNPLSADEASLVDCGSYSAASEPLECVGEASTSSFASSPSSLTTVGASGSPLRSPSYTECLLLEMLSDDCLGAVLAQCTLSQHLLSVAPTSRRLAELAEPHFMLFCAQNRWRPQRRLADHPFRWRVLLRQRACAVCIGAAAHFPVRKGSGGVSGGGAALFRLCRDCARRDKVQQQVNRHGYEVDAIGENGKALFARQFHIPLFGHANGFSNNLQAQVNKHGL